MHDYVYVLELKLYVEAPKQSVPYVRHSSITAEEAYARYSSTDFECPSKTIFILYFLPEYSMQ